MAIYLIMIYTLTLLNSQSQQKVANTLPLLHLLLPKTHSLLQNLLKTLDKLLRQEVRDGIKLVPATLIIMTVSVVYLYLDKQVT